MLDELSLYGPEAPRRAPPTLAESDAYCRRLARTHYENFTVASWCLPRSLRLHFYRVYAYCRWADDLADEVHDPERSTKLLDWWRSELDACYAGSARHPVFVALMDTVQTFTMPRQPLADLLIAFEQDQRVTDYETFDELLGYCRCSANPVGRLVLYLGRCHDEPNGRLADRICTGLQLANIWQDVARDYEAGRVYLPRESRRAAGYDDEMLARREYNTPFRRLMAAEVDRAEAWLVSGWPLVDRVPRSLAVDVELFIRGGLAVLEEIRRVDFNVWRVRPTVSKRRQIGLLLRSLASGRFRRRLVASRDADVGEYVRVEAGG